MSELDTWQKDNDAFLSAALAWMRLRLQKLAPAPAMPTVHAHDLVLVAPAPAPAPPQTPQKRGFFGGRGSSPPPPPTLTAAPPPVTLLPSPTDDDRIQNAAVAMAAAESAQPPPALVALAEQLGLSRFERDVLLLCAASELDTRIPSLCARAQDDAQRPFPTFALALALFDEPAWDALSPERPLRYLRLVEINQPGAQPLTASALRADERIVNYLKGLNYLDERVSGFLAPLEVDAASDWLAPSQAGAVDELLAHWLPPADLVAQLLGGDSLSKQLIAWHASARRGCQLFRLPIDFLPTHAAELETLARLWERENRLLPLALYVDAQNLDGGGAEKLAALDRFLARTGGVFFVAVSELLPHLGRSALVLDLAKPTPAEQIDAWTSVLGAGARGIAAPLAAQFDLNLPTIARLASTLRADPADSPATTAAKAWDACRAHERPRLDALAQRIEAKATWDDFVMPADGMSLLRQIAAQVGQRSKVYREWGFDRKMNRGFGISALFEGDSGTGKTMAAEVLANELRLNLYRIDLSAVVSKYIGETEKNLRRLFDAAENGGAILFFDEADALFGKRSEVKDSHDRYANIEVNYLLQRIESYRGLAILATNLKSALDTAFLRRLRFVVKFPFPAVADRRALWQKVFPRPGADGAPHPPVEALDYDRLARLNLTGGNIHNVALNAAFLAAQAGTAVTMPLLFSAARAEFQKLERPLNSADFKWTESGAEVADAMPPGAST